MLSNDFYFIFLSSRKDIKPYHHCREFVFRLSRVKAVEVGARNLYLAGNLLVDIINVELLKQCKVMFCFKSINTNYSYNSEMLFYRAKSIWKLICIRPLECKHICFRFCTSLLDYGWSLSGAKVFPVSWCNTLSLHYDSFYVFSSVYIKEIHAAYW